MKPAFILVLLLFVSITLISLDLTKKVYSIKLFIYYLFSPVSNTVVDIINKTGQIDNKIASLIKLYQENQLMKKQLNELRFIKYRYEEVIKDNETLSKFLNLRSQSRYKLVSARIILHDSSEWFRAAIIDKGLEDGICPDLPVISFVSSKEVLVGRVMECSKNKSKILLITDKLSYVPAKIFFSGDEGIIQGTDRKHLELKFLLPDGTVKIGDEVITSGIGEIFPSGLYIGTVKEIFKIPREYFKSATVQPYISINKIEEVFIVK